MEKAGWRTYTETVLLHVREGTRGGQRLNTTPGWHHSPRRPLGLVGGAQSDRAVRCHHGGSGPGGRKTDQAQRRPVAPTYSTLQSCCILTLRGASDTGPVTPSTIDSTLQSCCILTLRGASDTGPVTPSTIDSTLQSCCILTLCGASGTEQDTIHFAVMLYTYSPWGQ